MSFQHRVRRLLDVPDQLERMEHTMTSGLDALETAARRNGEAVAKAVTGVSDLRTKIAALESQIANGDLPPEIKQRLAAVTASIDASTDTVAQALIPVVADPATPTEIDGVPVAMPLDQNPATAEPSEVPDAVEAGQPLPDDLRA